MTIKTIPCSRLIKYYSKQFPNLSVLPAEVFIQFSNENDSPLGIMCEKYITEKDGGKCLLDEKGVSYFSFDRKSNPCFYSNFKNL